jgi:hypothetical protein
MVQVQDKGGGSARNPVPTSPTWTTAGRINLATIQLDNGFSQARGSGIRFDCKQV